MSRRLQAQSWEDGCSLTSLELCRMRMVQLPFHHCSNRSCTRISARRPDGTKMQPCRMSMDVEQSLSSNMKWAPGVQPRRSWKISERDILQETAVELKILAQTARASGDHVLCRCHRWFKDDSFTRKQDTVSFSGQCCYFTPNVCPGKLSWVQAGLWGKDAELRGSDRNKRTRWAQRV